MTVTRHFGRCSLVHTTWHTPEIGLMRWFRFPLGEMDAETGQPLRDWDWFCVVERKGPDLWAYGAKGMPALREFRDVLGAAALSGATRLRFQHRWIEHTFSLSKHKPKTNMTFQTKAQLINDESGKTEVDVTVNIYNLDSKEGSETLADAVKGITGAISGFDAQTGEPVK